MHILKLCLFSLSNLPVFCQKVLKVICLMFVTVNASKEYAKLAVTYHVMQAFVLKRNSNAVFEALLLKTLKKFLIIDIFNRDC